MPNHAWLRLNSNYGRYALLNHRSIPKFLVNKFRYQYKPSLSSCIVFRNLSLNITHNSIPSNFTASASTAAPAQKQYILSDTTHPNTRIATYPSPSGFTITPTLNSHTSPQIPPTTTNMSSQSSLEDAEIRYEVALVAHDYLDWTAAKRDIRKCKNDACQSARDLAKFADLEAGARQQLAKLKHYSDVDSFDPEMAKRENESVQEWRTMGPKLMEWALKTLQQFVELSEEFEGVKERLECEHSQACEGELN
jgi:hypothetical protein